MIVTLEKHHTVYTKDGESAICGRFIRKKLGCRPEKIKAHLRTKNPRKRGWTKAAFCEDKYGFKIVKVDKYSRYTLHSALRSILVSNLDNYENCYFWFKIEQIKIS